MFLFSADSGARPVPSELVLWCVVAFTKERSAWSSRTKMLNQSDWIISNCTSSLLLRELLLVPIGCSTLARLAAVHPSSAQPPPSPSLGPRSSATRSRKGLVCKILLIFTKFCKFLAGSFSAVSKRNFARKYAFDSIFQALQELHPFAPLQSQNFSKKSIWKISNFYEIFYSAKNLQMFI